MEAAPFAREEMPWPKPLPPEEARPPGGGELFRLRREAERHEPPRVRVASVALSTFEKKK